MIANPSSGRIYEVGMEQFGRLDRDGQDIREGYYVVAGRGMDVE
jgi:hypothetical protein